MALTEIELKAMFPNASVSLLAVNTDVKQCVVAKECLASDEQDFKQPENAFDGKERIMHRDFETDMRRRGVHVVHAREDQRSTIESGLPDFHLMFTGADGICRGCAIEFKATGGTVKPKQREIIGNIRGNKIPVLVAWNLADAIRFAREQLGC